jgi:ATP-dependent RNA helicase RhlE
MKFADYGIADEIIKQLDLLEFKRPTDIQYKCISHILRGEDVLAVAQTGTGKTAAFAIPIIDILHEKKLNSRRPDGVKCIVLVPTHELAQQITAVFQEIGKHTKVKTVGIFGGVDQAPQIAQLEKWIDVVIATPGRMFDLISQGHFRTHRVEILVLDEADHMLDLGFINDIHDLRQKLPKRRQTLFFSATINDHIKKLAYTIVNQQAVRIQVSPKNPVAKNIEHAVAFIEMDDKRHFLERFIHENSESKMLIFVRTKVRAERVLKAMERVDIKALTIHGDKNQEDRTDVMEKFRSGEEKILIATDVSARGIDIPNVDFVINYDLPEQPENYVHRVGRTGRGKNKGQAVSFCSEEEKSLLAEIEEYVGSEIAVADISQADYETTILLSQDDEQDWRALLELGDEIDAKRKGKKK